MRLTRRCLLALGAFAVCAFAAPASALAHHGHRSHGHHGNAVKHIVVIYEENHSFDNLYGGWEGVNGLASADAAHTTQVNQAGAPLQLPDAERRQPRRRRRCAPTCIDTTAARRSRATSRTRRSRSTTTSRPSDTTCPPPGVVRRPTACSTGTGRARRLHARPRAPLLPGAVPARRRPPEPLRHRQRRGRPDDGRTTTRSRCRSTSTCTRRGHPRYAIADHFFQAAFGGSFLNHQWLVAAATPVFPAPSTTAADDLHSVRRRQRHADAATRSTRRRRRRSRTAR